MVFGEFWSLTKLKVLGSVPVLLQASSQIRLCFTSKVVGQSLKDVWRGGWVQEKTMPFYGFSFLFSAALSLYYRMPFSISLLVKDAGLGRTQANIKDLYLDEITHTYLHTLTILTAREPR